MGHLTAGPKNVVKTFSVIIDPVYLIKILFATPVVVENIKRNWGRFIGALSFDLLGKSKVKIIRPKFCLIKITTVHEGNSKLR